MENKEFNAEEYLKTVNEWINSEKGQKEFAEILRHSREVTKMLEERRRPDWRSLERPMTI